MSVFHSAFDGEVGDSEESFDGVHYLWEALKLEGAMCGQIKARMIVVLRGACKFP